MGARVIAMDISQERLALAKRFGADVTINAGGDDPQAEIRDLTHGRGADMTLDTSGRPEGALVGRQSGSEVGHRMLRRRRKQR
jgi:threonine dehydrogenase-like Zn-dependent dehydrogenase